MSTVERHRLPFDPIEEAAKQWATLWGEMPRMRAVTSLMRVHQLLLTELDELLRPLGLTFARYEVLVLLSFSRRGSLPLGKIGERLQVHATSVTPLVKRLEAAELIRRTPHPEDGRAVLASITPQGRDVMEKATDAIVNARFGLTRVERGGMRSAHLVAHHAARGRRRLLVLELLAQSRVEPAYFVVARRGKNASAPSLLQHGGARFPDARS